MDSTALARTETATVSMGLRSWKIWVRYCAHVLEPIIKDPSLGGGGRGARDKGWTHGRGGGGQENQAAEV